MLAVLLPSQTAAEAFAIDSQWRGTPFFFMVATHSGKCVDVPAASSQEGVPLVQSTCWQGADSQKWALRDLGGGLYQLIAKHSAKCAEVRAGALADGVNVHQAACWAGAGQQAWFVRDAGAGEYEFIAQHSGKCLDVRDASLHDGAPIVQWTCSGRQRWRLIATP